jgi:hypothetical protein
MVEFSASSVVDDITDGGRGFLEAVDIGAGVIGGGARLVGEFAGIAHLRSDAFGRIGELAGGLRENSRGALSLVRAQAQRISALADCGKRGGRCFRAVGNGIGRAFELANHAAEFDFKQFENLPGGLCFRGVHGLDQGSRLYRRWFGRRRLGASFPEQSNRHEVTRVVEYDSGHIHTAL